MYTDEAPNVTYEKLIYCRQVVFKHRNNASLLTIIILKGQGDLPYILVINQ